ncbi:MAG TPA: pyridoxamine 5'-phosphate oxidase family protein [Acidimicrobiales bacterium]|nr:pyridoxamine 5'-phosphate oxidase family protein [Acidimicrobiales bacterium]
MAASRQHPAPTARTRVRRLAERARYERDEIYAILDEGFVCHAAFCDDSGPVVLPTGYARVGDGLYLHGATGNHLLRTVGAGAPVCITVTLVDGLVLARSAFHHSINYRSVVIFGTGREVEDRQEKLAAVTAVVDHIVPGRSADARPPTDEELRSTRVVHVPLDEASAKVRSGGPKDDPPDYQLPVWAGQVPLRLVAGDPVPDGDSLPEVPAYAATYRRPGDGQVTVR